MVWKGVVIEESLDDRDLFKTANIVGRRKTKLEAEDILVNLCLIEVSDSKIKDFLNSAKKSVKNGWYIHVVKDDNMVVIFRNKTFEFTKLQKNKIEEARKYGLSIGIIKEQMDFEHVIENPFD